jgi:hypothetical protein
VNIFFSFVTSRQQSSPSLQPASLINHDDDDDDDNETPLYTNLTDVTLTDAEQQILTKGPNFSITQRNNKEKILLDMKAGFQKLAHDVRWHCHQAMKDERTANQARRTHQMDSHSLTLSSLNHNSIPTNDIPYPLVSDRKEIILPTLIPEVETILKSCQQKYENVLKTVERRRMVNNLKPDERETIRRFQEKGLKIVPSDKGGDLCVIKISDYEKAISEHLGSSPMYRRVSMLKIEKLEERVNNVWIKVCKENKIPQKVKNMYTSKSTKFASMKAAIKTHKSSVGNIIIRPIISSIDSPGYHLSMFLQKLLQPLISQSTFSSDEIMSSIKSIDTEILSLRRYPISLDVENMFHNIPRQGAIECLKQRITESGLNMCSIRGNDIANLVSICIATNHFKHQNNLYVQLTGLPMGNRLSGILSELFMQKVQNDTYRTFTTPPPTYRYVDDLLIFTTGEEEAQNIYNMFNSNPYNIKFTIELPTNGVIPYLDFKISVTGDGVAMFDFFRKGVRKDNFINANTAIPKQAINSILKSEWSRIKNRCSDRSKLREHKERYFRRLERNGHNPNALRLTSTSPNPPINNNNLNPKFYLRIPFIDNTVERQIQKSLRELGLRVQIAHKTSQLRNVLSTKIVNDRCNIRNCLINSELCFSKGVVYQIKCESCRENYIGSTWRHLHQRVKEHVSQKTSPIYIHNRRCNGRLHTNILSMDSNTQRLRIKEALLIKQLNPSLNAKEDLLSTHILFQ